jgi:hypothetical protein
LRLSDGLIEGGCESGTCGRAAAEAKGAKMSTQLPIELSECRAWKLTYLQKLDAGMLFLTGMSQKELALRYKVSSVAIHRLLVRRGVLRPKKYRRRISYLR